MLQDVNLVENAENKMDKYVGNDTVLGKVEEKKKNHQKLLNIGRLSAWDIF